MANHLLHGRIQAAPDPVDRELEALLSEPLASACAAAHPPARAVAAALRSRLVDRAAASRAEASTKVTARIKRLAADALAPGVSARTLYAAPRDRALRPGEPLRALLVELQPGSAWPLTGLALQREWLVVRGSVRIDGEDLGPRDYHVVPDGSQENSTLVSETGAVLFLRESQPEPKAGAAACTVRDAHAGWPEFAPGIRRRVLWQRDGQAALLYLVDPGTHVPHHGHGHDEECLMVQGDLFLDDVLLQEGDYQLAPAGSDHHRTATDTGAVIYAHGDLELKFVD